MSENKIYHPRLTDRQRIETAVKDINTKVNGTGLDFREDTDGLYKSIAWINFNEPGMLIILASFDFSYYHDLEIVFYDVSYTDIESEYSWWGHWSKDQLELHDSSVPGEFEFRFNIGTHKEEYYTVRAKAFSCHFERLGRDR
jgi:hypothetical protein